MTMAAAEYRSHDAGEHLTLSPEVVEAVTTFVVRNLEGQSEHPRCPVQRVVAASTAALLACPAEPEQAVQRVAPLFWELGARFARHDRNATDLDAAFRQALWTAQRGIQYLTKGALPVDRQSRLRREITQFLQAAHPHARRGLEIADGVETPLDGRAEYQLAVLVDPTSMPRSVPAGSRVIRSKHHQELLVPADLDSVEIARLVGEQVVLGPVSPLFKIHENASLVRRAAALIREGMVVDARLVVPCSDLLSRLITDGLPGLVELLARKVLAPMSTWPARRRVHDGELLLAWLEMGQPVNQVARQLHLPPQTAHSRLQQMRKAFGDALDDPQQRIELVISLRRALPQWREELPH